ncbi:MAG: hypothetical protein ACLQNG_16655 [Acidimicrobiales bacterium]|jgi:hypothetical protein
MSSDDGVGGAKDRSVPPGNDWASLATAKVEEAVSLVRDRTVTPVLRAVRYAIFGLLAVSIGALLAVLVAAGAVRILDNYLFHRRVWASYLVIGGIFSGLGLFLSRMRHPRS